MANRVWYTKEQKNSYAVFAAGSVAMAALGLISIAKGNLVLGLVAGAYAVNFVTRAQKEIIEDKLLQLEYLVAQKE